MTSLDELLSRAAESDPDRIAVTDGAHNVYTYRQLYSAARAVAEWIRATVSRPPFLLLPGSTPDDVVLILGALLSGRVPLIGDPVWSAHEVRQTMHRTGASCLVSADPGSAGFDEDHRRPNFRFDGGALRWAAEDNEIRSCPADLTGIDFGRFTSGSSSSPRCLGFGETAMINAGRAWQRSTGLTAADTVACLASLNNGLAFNTSLLPVFGAGATLLVPNVKPLPSAILGKLRTAEPTVLVAFPFIYDVLAKRDLTPLRGLRAAISSAAPLSEATILAWQDALGLGICNYYGLAEVGPVTYNDGRTAGSLGRPLPGVRVEEVPAEGGAAGGPCRLAVRTESMATRYLDDLEPEFAAHLDADGYFRTQDLGMLRDGNLFVTGRADRIVNIAGRKINPDEVADVLRAYPGVTGAVVRGERSGDDWILCAYVETGTATRQELIEYCRDRLSQYKIPQRWSIATELPRSSAGKILSAGLTSTGAPRP